MIKDQIEFGVRSPRRKHEIVRKLFVDERLSARQIATRGEIKVLGAKLRLIAFPASKD